MIGCGSIGRRHLRNLKQLNAGLLLAWDPVPERLTEAARESQAKPVRSVDEGLGRGASLLDLLAERSSTPNRLRPWANRPPSLLKSPWLPITRTRSRLPKSSNLTARRVWLPVIFAFIRDWWHSSSR